MPIMASNARFASSPPGRQRLCHHARRDLPGDAPLVLPPAARTLLASIADNGVPVAVGLLLIIGGDLKRESFVMLERGRRAFGTYHSASRAIGTACRSATFGPVHIQEHGVDSPIWPASHPPPRCQQWLVRL